MLAAPTLFAEILNSFEKQCPNTYYDCDAELAGCIDNRLRGEMWEQSSATIKQSIFGSTGENTFVECVVFTADLGRPVFGAPENYAEPGHVFGCVGLALVH